MYKIMTPGPTQVRENVRLTRAMAATNPDLDPAFLDFYQTTCQKFARFLGASGQVYILGGEGILGLEAACASLTEPGDRVLVIDNGIFAKASPISSASMTVTQCSIPATISEAWTSSSWRIF